MVEDFGAVEVCCKIIVACVEPQVCDCVVSGFVFVNKTIHVQTNIMIV
jgi:hypothetical protein